MCQASCGVSFCSSPARRSAPFHTVTTFLARGRHTVHLCVRNPGPSRCDSAARVATTLAAGWQLGADQFLCASRSHEHRSVGRPPSLTVGLSEYAHSEAVNTLCNAVA